MSKDQIATRADHTQDETFQKPVTGTDVGSSKRALDVAIQSGLGGGPLATVTWDALDVQQTAATIETYVFYIGGLAGSVVATCVVTYTASSKSDLDKVEWS